MEAHFRAFSFVDQIQPGPLGRTVTGRYVIPAGLSAFPLSLVAEAVGQLAAWGAMSAVSFQYRPLAGIAGSIEMLTPVLPGQVIDLAVDLEAIDNEAVTYEGTALVNGTPVIRLQRCVGPMLPVEDFDDPEALRARFALLEGGGAPPGAFGGLPDFALQPIVDESAQIARAALSVPANAPFFADHFPRRPVFPGSLLMKINLELAALLAAGQSAVDRANTWAVRGVKDVKLRAFIPPGETLTIEGRWNPPSGETGTVTVETRNGQRLVSSARVQLAREHSA